VIDRVRRTTMFHAAKIVAIATIFLALAVLGGGCG